MFTATVIGGIILIVALLGCAFWCVYRAGRDDGYEARIADEAQQRADERTAARKAERKAPRHALTAPRGDPDKTSLVKSPARITWERDDAVGGPVEIPGGPSLAQYIEAMRAVRTVSPVVLPEPGTYLPQPGRDSGPGTITFATGPIGVPPRLREELSTTGEIAALKADTDAWLADRAVEEESFRLGLAT